MKEWIDYHRVIGFEHIYLYDDHSNDGYERFISHHIKSGYVSILHRKDLFPNDNKNHRGDFQLEAYRHFLETFGESCDWYACIDLDEFIVPHTHDDIREFLIDYEDEPVGSIYIQWQNFGTSYVKSLPANKLMIEVLHLKAFEDDETNNPGKSIARPECQQGITNYHMANLKPEYSSISMLRSAIQINHYMCRDQNFFYKVRAKTRRNPTFFPRGVSNREVEERFNRVEDLTIQRFVNATKKVSG